MVDTTENLVPFSLYHGTSSHYFSAFRPGTTPVPWPHKDVALRLLADAWTVLSTRRYEVPQNVRENIGWDVAFEDTPWFVKNVIEQASSYSNWQHGELYLTPSMRIAVSYACAGARFGGELLTFCNTAIDILANLDPQKAKELLLGAQSLAPLLGGSEQAPILVRFDKIRVDDLGTESTARDVREELASLTDGKMREVLGSEEKVLETLGQQTNFRLANGCGIVSQIFEVQVENIDQHSPLSSFRLKDIPLSEQTE